MKREGIAYGPVIGYTALLIAASGALGWVVTGSWYPLAILLVPVIGIAAYRLIGLYSDSIRRVTFMFNAIDNDDFTFRFHEDPSKVDNGMLNAALNRIKEILVRAKVRAEERERYYQLIMEYARTGLITINDAGSVYQANGEALRMGPTEFRLLHYLMKHAEPVHSRTQLLDRVWSDHVSIEERTVDVHIKRLRESMDNAAHMIETVRGAGYRITAIKR